MSTRNDHLTARSSLIGVGEAAPDFALMDQDRKEWKLSDAVRQGDVVLCFVPMAFTSVCTTEMGCVNRESERWAAKGATVVGISCDTFAAQKAWCEKEGFSQHLLADMHRQVCKAYGLYWADLNVAQRGTVIVGKSADGKGKVKFAEAREPSKAMDCERVLGMVG